MWAGYEKGLAFYAHLVLDHAEVTFNKKYVEMREKLNTFDSSPKFPEWTTNLAFNISHASNLVRKSNFYWFNYSDEDIPGGLPYIWPSRRSSLLEFGIALDASGISQRSKQQIKLDLSALMQPKVLN